MKKVYEIQAGDRIVLGGKAVYDRDVSGYNGVVFATRVDYNGDTYYWCYLGIWKDPSFCIVRKHNIRNLLSRGYASQAYTDRLQERYRHTLPLKPGTAVRVMSQNEVLEGEVAAFKFYGYEPISYMLKDCRNWLSSQNILSTDLVEKKPVKDKPSRILIYLGSLLIIAILYFFFNDSMRGALVCIGELLKSLK